MKTNRFIWVALAVATFATAVRAEEIVTNRLNASLRFGLNIKARFKGTVGPMTPPPGTITRTTPDGDPYNYDDGYVLSDVSGNAGGQTWYWGYDNSATYPAGQISDGVAFPANTVLLSRSTPNGNFASPEMDDGPHLGFEVTYDRHLVSKQRINYGVEFAANYLSVSIHDRGAFAGSAARTTDAYPYTPGTTPPSATSGNPYQGSYDGFGFLIGDTPVASSTALVPDGYTISGVRKLDADLWGMRLGPYADYPIGEKFNIWLSAGLAVGLLSADASWSESLSLPGPVTLGSIGNGSDTDFRMGWYVSGNISWDITERWSAFGGVQFQGLGQYSHDFGGRTVELDLSKSFFITIGASYRF
jgi:hypothetical protein